MSPAAKLLYERLSVWVERLNLSAASRDSIADLAAIAEEHDAAVEAYWMGESDRLKTHWLREAEQVRKTAEESVLIIREASARTISDYQKQIAELTK